MTQMLRERGGIYPANKIIGCEQPANASFLGYGDRQNIYQLVGPNMVQVCPRGVSCCSSFSSSSAAFSILSIFAMFFLGHGKAMLSQTPCHLGNPVGWLKRMLHDGTTQFRSSPPFGQGSWEESETPSGDAAPSSLSKLLLL